MSFPLSVICVAAFAVWLLITSWNVFIQGKDIIEMKKKLNMETKVRKSDIKEAVLWFLLGFALLGVIYAVNHFVL